MKANNKRKVFGDAVDLLMDEIEERDVPRGIQMIQIKNIQPFHDHPFYLYEGERLEDMVASVKEHGILNPVIVQKMQREETVGITTDLYRGRGGSNLYRSVSYRTAGGSFVRSRKIEYGGYIKHI